MWFMHCFEGLRGALQPKIPKITAHACSDPWAFSSISFAPFHSRCHGGVRRVAGSLEDKPEGLLRKKEEDTAFNSDFSPTRRGAK